MANIPDGDDIVCVAYVHGDKKPHAPVMREILQPISSAWGKEMSEIELYFGIRTPRPLKGWVYNPKDRAWGAKYRGSLSELATEKAWAGLPSNSRAAFVVPIRNKNNFLKTKWSLQWTVPSPIESHDHLSDTYIQVSLRVDDMGSEPDAIAWTVLRGFFQAVSRVPECYYGLVDIASQKEICSGMYYSSTPLGPMAWRRRLDHDIWLERGAESRLNKARGIYWGNYFGPSFVRRAKIDQSFVDRFLDHCTIGDTQTALEYSSGALLLTLSENPLDMSLREGRREPWMHISRRGAWLHHELRKRNAMI